MDTVKQEKSNVLVIAVMFLLFFMIAFVTNFAGSMGVIVKTQFGASNALSQLGTLANFIAYACFGIPVGLILKRRGYKFTSLLATIVGFVGVGIQIPPSRSASMCSAPSWPAYRCACSTPPSTPC